VYRAKWKDREINGWNVSKYQWYRSYSDIFVAFKCFNNSQNTTLEFINEVINLLLMKISENMIFC